MTAHAVPRIGIQDVCSHCGVSISYGRDGWISKAGSTVCMAPPGARTTKHRPTWETK